MSYTTIERKFTIDEQNPADVFKEMSDFFDLFVKSIDCFHRMSIKISIPARFSLEQNPNIANAYQQFLASVSYVVPTVYILPVEVLQTHELNLNFMIQFYKTRRQNNRSWWTKIFPIFASEQTDNGFYPQSQTQTVNNQPQPQQPTPTPPPTPTQNVPPVQQPPVRRPVQPQRPTPQPQEEFLPNPRISMRPYCDILSQAVINEALRKRPTQPIKTIQLESNDSLTTSMITMLFESFHQVRIDRNQAPHDAIDLSSYGHEELKPKLRQVNVTLADEANFQLNTTEQPNDENKQRLINRQVRASDIQLRARFLY